MEIKNKYYIKCSYYQKSFETVQELVDTVVQDGMDPNYDIYYNGKKTGEQVIDLIQF